MSWIQKNVRCAPLSPLSPHPPCTPDYFSTLHAITRELHYKCLESYFVVMYCIASSPASPCSGPSESRESPRDFPITDTALRESKHIFIAEERNFLIINFNYQILIFRYFTPEVRGLFDVLLRNCFDSVVISYCCWLEHFSCPWMIRLLFWNVINTITAVKFVTLVDNPIGARKYGQELARVCRNNWLYEQPELTQERHFLE